MKDVYLDYSANTPVSYDVLDYYCEITKKYTSNPNSIHTGGTASKIFLKSCEKNIANILNCSPRELIFTSSACESNSMVFRGIEREYRNKNHIITSKLEHKSVLDEVNRLSRKGYFISYVKIKENGLVDLDDLKRLINENTALVSICGVNSETGFVQDLKSIRKVIDSVNPKILFHSDLTQALGKINIDLSFLDLASFSSHKIYAPSGLGLLYKNSRVSLENLIGGGTLNTPLRGGTPSLHLIGAFSYALSKIYKDIDKNYKYVEKLNKKLVDGLKKYDININSNENSIPFIINFSLINMPSLLFIQKMSLKGIYVSSKSACSSQNESIVLSSLTNDKKITCTSIRVSLSHLTTIEEIDYFLDTFEAIYKK